MHQYYKTHEAARVDTAFTQFNPILFFKPPLNYVSDFGNFDRNSVPFRYFPRILPTNFDQLVAETRVVIRYVSQRLGATTLVDVDRTTLVDMGVAVTRVHKVVVVIHDSLGSPDEPHLHVLCVEIARVARNKSTLCLLVDWQVGSQSTVANWNQVFNQDRVYAE